MVTIEQQNKVWDIGKNINEGVEHARKFPDEGKFRIKETKGNTKISRMISENTSKLKVDGVYKAR